MSSYRELVREGESLLAAAGVADAGLDAWYLLEFVLDRDRSWYYLHMDEEAAGEEADRYRTLLVRRSARVPLQQITGMAYFMGLSFFVDEHVLLPRQDTELLTEEALRILKPEDKVLDLCTGSGCILLSLLYNGRENTGVGADISEEALLVARKNSERLNIPAVFVQSDLFAQIPGRYDMIVSNPPYIPSGVIPGLMEEVRDHEPRIALDGGPDGLDFYRRIIGEAPEHLRGGGRLLLEIGYDQGEAVCSMMESAGYREVRLLRDLAGLDRVITGRRN